MNGLSDRYALACQIRKSVLDWVRMPVSIGIAPTKTLAKVANKIGKNKPSGVCELCPKEYTDYILSNFDISDIWGIGRQLSKKLNIHGIYTAKQLSEASDRWVRKLYNVGLERTVRELRGEPCIDFETAPTPKTIIVSRMFGKKLYNQSEIGEALAKYCGHAATKLRKNNLVAKNMTIFIQATEGYGKNGNNYSCRYNFDNGTDSTIFLSQMAHRMLGQIFRPTKKYLRAGIMLDQL